MTPAPTSSSAQRLVPLLAVVALALAGLSVWTLLPQADSKEGAQDAGSLRPGAAGPGLAAADGRVSDALEDEREESSSGSAGVRAPDTARSQVDAQLPEAEALREAQLLALQAERAELVEGRARVVLAGRVRAEASGAPISNANIQLEHGPLSSSARSQADGRFELSWWDELSGALAVQHALHVDISRPDQGALIESELEFVLTPSAALRGRLTPAPEGAEVEALLIHQRATGQKFWESLRAPVDASGGFAFVDLEPGQYALTAMHSAAHVGIEMGIELAPGERRELVLEAAPSAWLAARVLRADDRTPLAGARLLLRSMRPGLPGLLRRELEVGGESDAEGRVRIDGLSPGTWRALLDLPWGSREFADLHVSESGEELEHEFLVAPPAELSGIVRDAAGRAVPEAEVVACARDDARRQSLLGGLAGAGGLPWARCDASGRFRLEGLPTGKALVLLATAPGQPQAAPGWAQAPALWPAEQGPEVIVELPVALELRGQVRDARGEALEGVHVALEYPFDGKGALRYAEVTSRADGSFEFSGLMRGRASLRTQRDGFQSARQLLDIEAEASARVTLVLEATYRVEAMVVDTRGHAVVGIPVRIERVSASGAEEEPGARSGQRYLSGSDAEGRVRFPALTAGDWRASGGSFEWELVGADPPVLRVPSDDFVRLELRRRSRPERAGLRGEVQLAGGGVPLGLEVGGLQGGVLEIDGGRFEASGLVPTRHRLQIQAAGHRPLVLHPVDMVAGGVTDLGTLVLEPATRVVVLVRDPQEQSLRKARVRLVPLAGSAGGVGVDDRALDFRHEGAGRFSTDHALRAAWSLRVSCPGFRAHEQTVFVEPVEQQQWTVRLLPAE